MGNVIYKEKKPQVMVLTTQVKHSGQIFFFKSSAQQGIEKRKHNVSALLREALPLCAISWQMKRQRAAPACILPWDLKEQKKSKHSSASKNDT